MVRLGLPVHGDRSVPDPQQVAVGHGVGGEAVAVRARRAAGELQVGAALGAGRRVALLAGHLDLDDSGPVQPIPGAPRSRRRGRARWPAASGTGSSGTPGVGSITLDSVRIRGSGRCRPEHGRHRPAATSTAGPAGRRARGRAVRGPARTAAWAGTRSATAAGGKGCRSGSRAAQHG